MRGKLEALRQIFRFSLIVLVFLIGCTQTTTSIPTPIAEIPTLALTPTAVALAMPSDTGWVLLRPGLERRILRELHEDGRVTERLYVLRLEPALFTWGIGYHPGAPQSLTAWQAETDALLVVNGGFFTEAYEATGRIVVDGIGYGLSYGHFAGMLAMTDSSVEVRWLQERPYDMNEPLQDMLQSFPVLVKPGGRFGFTEEDGQAARRTVVAQDINGRILFIVTSETRFTLRELSRTLTFSDFELDIALNLDGGPSTGLLLAEPQESIPAFSLLPTVITVHSR